MQPKNGRAGTRETILQAALRLFAQHGYGSTTTRMIAQEAGVAEGTIYIYFRTKRDLLFALLERASLPVLRDIFANAVVTSDEAVLKSLLRDRLEFGEQYANLLRTLLPQAIHDEQVAEQLVRTIIAPAAAMVKEYIAQKVKDGVFREVEADIATRLIAGAFWFTILFDHLLACRDETKAAVLKRHTAEEYATEFAKLFLGGLKR